MWRLTSGKALAAGASAAILLLPFAIHNGMLLSLACLAATMAVATLSYSILLGQTGLLSFGHALYVGLGGFAVANFTQAAEIHGWSWFSVAYAPLFGGLLSLAVALVLGFINSRRTGVVFAMITLGLAEMVHAYAITQSGFFGGDAGVSFDRTSGEPLMGWSFGPQVQIYGLILVWMILCLAIVAAFRVSVLGDLCRAVRDNEERVEFLGFNPRRIRYLAFCLSAFVAGVAGGLAAINFEVVSAQVLSLQQSSAILVATFIGGATSLWGSIAGALVYVFFYSVVSSVTEAWPFHLGIVFMATVLFAPRGFAGLVQELPGRLHAHWRQLGAFRFGLHTASAMALVMLYVGAVEAVYTVAHGQAREWTSSVQWVLAGALVVVAGLPFALARLRPSPAVANERAIA